MIRLGLAKTFGMAVLAATFFAPLGPMVVQADSPAAKSTAPAGKVTICHKGHVVIPLPGRHSTLTWRMVTVSGPAS